MEHEAFKEIVWDYYRREGRMHLPWREDPVPYHVLVSELMLQQTQVERVIPKYTQFMERFPTVESLAQAPLADVLVAWQGLGYNRRAKFLHEAAKQITRQGSFPETKEGLVALPGVGAHTAGAVLAYAFNQPVTYIETNIRTVFLHHFFPDALSVSDAELFPIVEATVDAEHPREWYSALMDYGSHLKKQGYGRTTVSAHYKKQSQFKGSMREMRGRILRALAGGPRSDKQLRKYVDADERYEAALNHLINEKMIITQEGVHRLPMLA